MLRFVRWVGCVRYDAVPKKLRIRTGNRNEVAGRSDLTDPKHLTDLNKTR